MKLTAESARDLPPNATLADHVVRGLQLRHRDRSKGWSYRYTAPDGRQRRALLGHFPTIGLEAARKLARELAERIARGEDPTSEKRALREAPTVADLANLFLDKHASRLAPRTRAEHERNIRLHVLPNLGRLRVGAVTREAIDRTLDKVPGPVGANRVRQCLHTMFELAAHDDHKWRPKASNPVTDSHRRPERKRRRKIERHEFEGIARELDKLQPAYPYRVAAIRVILFCGTRITELITAKRSELKGDRIILAQHKTMSTGEDREIFLPAQALQIINSLPDDGSGFIFGRGLTRYDIFFVWALARKAVPSAHDLRPMDLRRTFGSVAGSVGIGLDALGQLYGHLDPDTTRGYQWLYDDAAVANTQATADKIDKLMSGSA